MTIINLQKYIPEAAEKAHEAGLVRASESPLYPPCGNTGGALRHDLINKEKNSIKKEGVKGVPAAKYPPSRASRRKVTSPEMQAFLHRWFIDWLTVSVPNSRDGTGRRIGTFETEDGITAADVEQGEYEETVARDHLFAVATAECLRAFRVGRGSDGFHGASHLSFDPTDNERVATIRAGHATNLPSMELPGSSGKCATLAPAILRRLGPVNVARVDVTFDISAPGLWDDIDAMAVRMAATRKMKAPRYLGTEEEGRTMKMGSGDVSVTVYEKSFERLARGKIADEDHDPNLVRIEFSIHEQHADGKAAVGRYLQERGDDGELLNHPGDLLKNYAWVREFVENLAVLTRDVAPDAARLEVGRMNKMPVSRPAIVRAKTAARQYARTFCNAAIVQIVDDEFDGDWQSATTTPDAVTDVAIEMLRPFIESRALDLCDFHGLNAVQRNEEEALRQSDMLSLWLERDADLKDLAQAQLCRAAEKAREDFGMPDVLPPILMPEGGYMPTGDDEEIDQIFAMSADNTQAAAA
ncbi:hypothetical protein [uncultured Sulfitobacter sp.]|uniref:hypothetical protein n=1 Tax=uncultured Sulfitobacter sp. TaxID=191468 RepID=UPI002592392A|nr:hypothetical protein [uncultured Sulfitobacter sp.]